MVYQVPLDLDQDAHQQEYYEKSRSEIVKSEEDSEADAGGDADAEKESQVKPRTLSSFQVYDASCQGLIFIGIRHDLDPAPFLRRFMELTIPSEDGSPAKLKWPKETFIERLLPVQKTCAATLATIAETIKPMIAQHLGDDVEPTSWGIVAHHRNNPDVARKSLIDTVAALVPSKHPVELSKPTVTIIIEVIKSACCISFSRDFNTLAKYNPSNYILQKSKSGFSSASEQASSSNAQS
jgi:tRNA acetyltransferase TAN1